MTKIDLTNLGNISNMSKDQIKEIQQALINSGFLDRTFESKFGTRDNADGYWGRRSQAALDAYNAQYGKKDFSRLGTGFMWEGKTDFVPQSQKPVQETTNSKLESDTTLSDRISENIPWTSRVISLAAQIGDHALNQGSRITMGIKENPKLLIPDGSGPLKWIKAAVVGTAKGNELADKVESKELTHKDLYNTSFLGNTNLTNAEKRQALAILTYRNNNQPISYESYLKDLEYLKSRPPGKYSDGLGEDGFIMIGTDPYKFTNRQEDRRNYVGVEDGSLLSRIFSVGKRMYHDPNRGRMGSWGYRVNPNGDIEIIDRFEGTDKVAASGKNDTKAYDATRAIWFRGTTHDLNGKISTNQSQRWYKQAQED